MSTWNEYCNNSGTVGCVLDFDTQMETVIQEITDIVEQKCGHKPNTFVCSKGIAHFFPECAIFEKDGFSWGHERILIAYHQPNERFDSSRYGRITVHLNNL